VAISQPSRCPNCSKAETVHAAAGALRSQLAETGVNSIVHALTLVVTSQTSIEAAFETLSSTNGPLSHVDNRLDVTVRNAAVGAPPNHAGKGQQTMFIATELTTDEDIEQKLCAPTSPLLPLLRVRTPHSCDILIALTPFVQIPFFRSSLGLRLLGLLTFGLVVVRSNSKPALRYRQPVPWSIMQAKLL
jgi:hypothetical protein